MTVLVSNWSDVPSSNGTVDGINIAEGCPSAGINGAIRSVMAGVKTLSGTIPSTASFMPVTGGLFTGGIYFSGSGAYLYHANSANVSGRIFVQASGGAVPAMSNGDLLIEY